jgi:DNA-binding NarL/FixJ family response regulator
MTGETRQAIRLAISEAVRARVPYTGNAAGLEHQRGKAGTRPPSNPLTPRRREIIALLADGLSIDEIALRLGISRSGVKRHMEALRVALGCFHSRDIPTAFARVVEGGKR